MCPPLQTSRRAKARRSVSVECPKEGLLNPQHRKPAEPIRFALLRDDERRWEKELTRTAGHVVRNLETALVRLVAVPLVVISIVNATSRV